LQFRAAPFNQFACAWEPVSKEPPGQPISKSLSRMRRISDEKRCVRGKVRDGEPQTRTVRLIKASVQLAMSAITFDAKAQALLNFFNGT
jgi:hypothetical protein